MPTQINGLPAHVLLIHVIVVFGPLAALFLVLSAVWPAARRRLGVFSPITALIVLIFTPITTNAGEWLEHKLEQGGENKAIEKHANLGDTFLYFAIALFVVSAAVWLLSRRYEFGLVGTKAATQPADSPTGGTTMTQTRTQLQTLPTLASVAIAVVSVVVALVTVWQLYRIGDSGAHAAWDYVQKLQ